MADFLLKEDGGKLLKEDGGTFVLESPQFYLEGFPYSFPILFYEWCVSNTGTVTSSGSISRSTIFKILEGTITPSGVVTVIRTVLKSLSGSVYEIIGTLSTVKWGAANYFKSLDGTVASVGDLVKTTSKAMVGAFSSGTGALTKRTMKSVLGAVPIIQGGLIKSLKNRILSGVVSSYGSVSTGGFRTVSLSGLITPSGILTRNTYKSMSGQVSTITGSIGKIPKKLLTGDVMPVGTVLKNIKKSFSGSLSSIGQALVGLLGESKLIKLTTRTRPYYNMKTRTRPYYNMKTRIEQDKE